MISSPEFIYHPWVGDYVKYMLYPADQTVRVMEPYRVCIPEYVIGRKVHIDIWESFLCDGFSVPKLLQWWGPPLVVPEVVSAVTHDFGWANNTPKLERREWDTIFFYEMRLFEVRYTKALAKYYGVRVFGWPVWIRYRK